MDDVRTKYWLQQSMSINNRTFWPRVKKTIKFMAFVSCAYAILWWTSHGVEVKRSNTIQEYIACNASLEPYTRLVEMTNISGKYSCSTKFQYLAQPCLCCLFDICWRDYYIVPFSNSTTMATVVDRVNGVIYERKIPKHAEFCYKMWNSSAYDRCIKEEGHKVAYLLRARELLYGWGPAGLVVDSQ